MDTSIGEKSHESFLLSTFKLLTSCLVNKYFGKTVPSNRNFELGSNPDNLSEMTGAAARQHHLLPPLLSLLSFKSRRFQKNLFFVASKGLTLKGV